MSDFDAESHTTQVNRQVSNTVSADYTLQKEDEGSIVIVDSSSSIVEITIPSDASVNIPVGTVIWLYRDGANFVRLVEDTGVTLYPNEGRVAEDKTEIYIRKQATNEWIVGDTEIFEEIFTATGGTVSDITVNGVDYRVHEFTTVGTSTFEVLSGSASVEYLIVGGGGATDGGLAGGGAGGGYRCSVPGELSGGNSPPESKANLTTQSYDVVVGAGGVNGSKGGDSSFADIISIGGGRGGGNPSYGGIDGGGDGGSGGGGPSRNNVGCSGVDVSGGSGTAGQGFSGGAGNGSCTSFNDAGGGGGGAGEAGQNSPGVKLGGTGGDGIESSITGTPIYRAGGGAGNGLNNNPLGGLGGGGNDDGTGPTKGEDGKGGGAGANFGDGGSGIVIIRYPI